MNGPTRVIADLRELAKRTSNERGAQRLCWGPIWRDARAWFTDKVSELGLGTERDPAGNLWVTLPGASDGLNALFTPDWGALTDLNVWIAAYSQIFFSMSIAFGIMIAYSSFQRRRANMTSSGLVLSLIHI